MAQPNNGRPAARSMRQVRIRGSPIKAVGSSLVRQPSTACTAAVNSGERVRPLPRVSAMAALTATFFSLVDVLIRFGLTTIVNGF